MRQLKQLLFIVLLLIFSYPVKSQENLTIDVMGSLMVGNIYHIEAPQSQEDWKMFESRLRVLKRVGIDAISVDIWWGLVERSEGFYDWTYYDKIEQIIEKAGLRWKPIMSFHKLGGNVNDPEQEINLPRHIIDRAEKKGLFYTDNKGVTSNQVISVWGVGYVLKDYQRFFAAFLDHFRHKTSLIKEIYIGTGASSELRIFSYIPNTYPGPGSVNAYSDLAIKSFRKFLREKYLNSEIALNKAWGTNGLTFDNIAPPQGDDFYIKGKHLEAYGKDFFDFYHQSLIKAGETVLSGLLDVIDHSNIPGFKNTPIGIKIPSVDWTIGEPDMNKKRLAELFAGLVTTSSPYFLEPSTQGAGYVDVMEMISRVSKEHNRQVNATFTGIEKRDDEDPGAWSKAASLLKWVLEEAKREDVILEGENALPSFYKNDFWSNIDNVLKLGVKSVTILRMDDLFVEGDKRVKELTELIDVHLKGQMLLKTLGYVPDGFENMNPSARQELVVDEITKKIFMDLRGSNIEEIIENNKELFIDGSFLLMLADKGLKSPDVAERKVILEQVESVLEPLKKLNQEKTINVPYKCIDAISNKVYQLSASIYQPDMPRLLQNIREYFRDNEGTTGNDDQYKIVETAAWRIQGLAEEVLKKMSTLDVKNVNIELLQKMIYGTESNAFRDGLLYYLEWRARSLGEGASSNEFWYQWSTLNYLYFGLLPKEEIDINKLGGSDLLYKLSSVAAKQQRILRSEASGYRTRMELVDRLREQVESIRINVEERIKRVK